MQEGAFKLTVLASPQITTHPGQSSFREYDQSEFGAGQGHNVPVHPLFLLFNILGRLFRVGFMTMREHSLTYTGSLFVKGLGGVTFQ